MTISTSATLEMDDFPFLLFSFPFFNPLLCSSLLFFYSLLVLSPSLIFFSFQDGDFGDFNIDDMAMGDFGDFDVFYSRFLKREGISMMEKRKEKEKEKRREKGGKRRKIICMLISADKIYLPQRIIKYIKK
jgi:hypothetical protein